MKEKGTVRLAIRIAFSLVELIVTVIIIGTLAGMMLLSFAPASDSAKAAKIISDIKSMRSAAILYRADRGDWPIWIYVKATGEYSAISGTSHLPSKYSSLTTEGDGYWVGAMKGSDGAAYAVVYVADLDDSVRNALEKKSGESVLYGEEYSKMKMLRVEDVLSSPYKAEHDMLIAITSR